MAGGYSKDKRRKGTIAGLCLIAFGIVSAIYSYFQDKGSFDYLRMSNASEYAWLHIVLWTIAGLVVIAWYNLGPPRPPDEAPFQDRDDNRDGMR